MKKICKKHLPDELYHALHTQGLLSGEERHFVLRYEDDQECPVTISVEVKYEPRSWYHSSWYHPSIEDVEIAFKFDETEIVHKFRKKNWCGDRATGIMSKETDIDPKQPLLYFYSRGFRSSGSFEDQAQETLGFLCDIVNNLQANPLLENRATSYLSPSPR